MSKDGNYAAAVIAHVNLGAIRAKAASLIGRRSASLPASRSSASGQPAAVDVTAGAPGNSRRRGQLDPRRKKSARGKRRICGRQLRQQPRAMEARRQFKGMKSAVNGDGDFHGRTFFLSASMSTASSVLPCRAHE